MTKEEESRALIEAIYNATRQGITVSFSKDFEGQMTVSLTSDGVGTHTHVGKVGADIDQALPAIVGQAQRFIDGGL